MPKIYYKNTVSAVMIAIKLYISCRKNIDMEQEIKKSWFKRNWLWFIPTMGCLTLIILGILGVGTLIFGVTKMLSNSTPSTYAFEQAVKNRKVISLLGEPIEKRGMASGNISYSNNDGKADLNIPIIGSKGKGTIVVKATKTDGVWSYETLYVYIKETRERINLLAKVLEDI
jgi:hypothetical protein